MQDSSDAHTAQHQKILDGESVQSPRVKPGTLPETAKGPRSTPSEWRTRHPLSHILSDQIAANFTAVCGYRNILLPSHRETELEIRGVLAY